MSRRAPSLRRFAAGALACLVAVFGVLALRVHEGQDPALGTGSAKASSSSSSGSSSDGTTSQTPSGTSSDQSGDLSSQQDQQTQPDTSSGWSSGAPTTRAS